MLQNLREKSTGWVATIILGILIIPFVFVGVNEYAGGGNSSAVATVEAPPTWWKSAPSWWPVSHFWQKREITQQEFRDRFEQVRQQQRETLGDRFDPREFESTENKLLVLEQLISQKALELTAEEAGIVIGNEALMHSIAGTEAFQVDGKFDAARYQMLLSSQVPPVSIAEFERRERDRLKMTLIMSEIAESDFITDGEVSRLYGLLAETRDIRLALLPEQEADQAEVSDQEITAWYEANTSDFRQPESVTLEYVEIDSSTLPAAAAADEATLRLRYEQEMARFAEAEQRLASHILISVDADAGDAAWADAERKIKELAAQARQPGADFAALAREHSQDPGSKDAGGDLGWVEKGIMVKPFEDALFAMQAGEVSEPVRTQFGYHVLQLREVKTGNQVPFEQVRDELAREQAEADHDRAFNDLLGQLVNEVLKNPTSLSAAANALNLQVQRTGPISRASPSGIAVNPAVLRAAFSEMLLQDRVVSDPIEIGPGNSVLIRVLEHTPEQARPLDDVRDEVIAAIRADRRSKAAAAAADALLARIGVDGATLESVAAAENLQVADLPGVPRGAPMPTQEINEAVFVAPRPVEGKPSFGKVSLEDGRYVLFAVDNVTDGDLAALPPEQQAQIKAQLQELGSAASAQRYIDSVRKKYKVTIKEDQL